MSARLMPWQRDPLRPSPPSALTVSVEGEEAGGLVGQTIAGVLLGAGRTHWRTTSATGQPRGVFCGIGVCFDCLVVVNGERDVRACLRRAQDGDVIERQHDELPVPAGETAVVEGTSNDARVPGDDVGRER